MLITLIVDDSLRSRVEQSSSTTEFLQKQIGELKARIDALGSELAKYKRKGKHRSVQEEFRYRSLLREYEQSKETYKILLQKREQSEISTTLERQQPAYIVLEPASLPNAPDFPNRILCAVGGLAVGLALTLVLALLGKSTPIS